MLEFTNPDWLKRRLGNVSTRIGTEGSIEIERIDDNIVFFRLIKSDGSSEFMPASKALSKLIIEKKVKSEDISDYEILELTSGLTCISINSGFIEF